MQQGDTNEQQYINGSKAWHPTISHQCHLTEAMLHNQRQVVGQITEVQDLKTSLWRHNARIGGVECLVHQDSGHGGKIGVMGRARIWASREAIVRALMDPSCIIQSRQTMEIVAQLPSLAAVPWDAPHAAASSKSPNLAGLSVDGLESQRRLLWVGLQLPLISNRDFCVVQHSNPMIDHATPPEAWSWILGSISVEDSRVPLRRKYIRGQTLLSGWLVKPLEHGCCGVTFVSISKLNGKIPSAVLKMGNKEGGEMVLKLKKVVERDTT